MSYDPRDRFDEDPRQHMWQQDGYSSAYHRVDAAGTTFPTESYVIYGSNNRHGAYPDHWAPQQGPHAYLYTTAYPVDHYYPEHIQSQWGAASHQMEHVVSANLATAYADMNGVMSSDAVHPAYASSQQRRAPCLLNERCSSADDHSSSVSTGESKSKPQHHKLPTSQKPGKRFAWTESLHHDFVNAIFVTGLKR